MRPRRREQIASRVVAATSDAYEGFLRRKWIIVGAAATSVALLLGAPARLDFLRDLAPRADEAALTIWQVHAAFISISFAGISIAFQVLAEPPLTAGPARRAVIDYIRYPNLLAQGILADLIIGTVAIWLRSDVNIAVTFCLVFVPSVLVAGLAYFRLSTLFAHPHMLEGLTVDDLKRRTARALERIGSPSESDLAFAKAVHDKEFLRTSFAQDAGQRIFRSVRHTGTTGIVDGVRIAALERVANTLDSAALAVSAVESSPETASAESTIIIVRIAPGDRVYSGTVLMHVLFPSSERGRDAWPALANELSKSIVVSTTKIDARELLELELSELQDSIVGAISDRRIARVQRGFGYYNDVLEEVAAYRPQQEFALRPSWRWLEQQSWEIDDAAAAGNRRTAMVAIDSAMSRSMRAVERDDVEALRAALRTYAHVWEGVLLLRTDDVRYSKEHLLVSLQNLCEFYIPSRSLSSSPKVSSANACVWVFVDLAKSALDAGAQLDAERAMAYMGGLFQFGHDEFKESRKHVAAGLLALGGWILYSRERQNELDKAKLSSILERLEGLPIFEGLLLLDERSEDLGSWRFWELRESLPFAVTTMSLHGFAIRFGLLAMRHEAAPRINSDDDFSLLQRLVGESSNLADHWPSDVARDSGVVGAVDRFNAALAAWETRQQAEEAAMGLDEERVQRFVSSFATALVSPRRLSDWFLAADGRFDFSADEAKFLYLNVLVPKFYFIDSPRAWANPDDLARGLAGAIVRGEDSSIIALCREVGAVTSTTLAELTDRLLETIVSMARPFVILMNSGEVMYELAMDHQGDTVKIGDADIPAFALFDVESDEHVLVVDLEAAPALERKAEMKAGMTPLDGLDVAVGVFDEGSRSKSTGEPEVRIETGERLRWHMPPAAAAHFFKVADSTW